MGEISISGVELLFAVTASGGERFYGIHDPLWALDAGEILLKQNEASLSLEKKGFVSLGFDESMVFEPSLEEIVKHCTFCEQFLMLNTICSGRQQPPSVFYFKDNRIAQLRQGLDEEYILSWVEKDAFFDRILTQIHKNSVPHQEAPACAISTQEMSKLQGRFTAKGKAVEFSSEIPKEMGNILERGLKQEADYSVVMLRDIEQRTVEHIICIHAPEGSLRLWQNLLEGEDSWRICYTDREELNGLLRKLVG